jgi:hypothetical protein
MDLEQPVEVFTMHELIRVMVYAKDAESALNAAREIVSDYLVGPFPEFPFDSAVDFTYSAVDAGGLTGEMMFAAAMTESGIPCVGGFGKDRWEDIPPVLQVSTIRFPCDDPRGMEQAKLAMDNTLEEFKENMKHLRDLIAKYTDEELFASAEGIGDDPSDLQWHCEKIAWVRNGAFLYDFLGHPITRISHLQDLVADPDADHNNEFMDDPEMVATMSQPLWIVPFDVHM